MPGLDQTGPMGQGSMTGRRLGRCTNFGGGKKNHSSEHNENTRGMHFFRGARRGLGRFGRGMGKGFNRGNQ